MASYSLRMVLSLSIRLVFSSYTFSAFYIVSQPSKSNLTNLYRLSFLLSFAEEPISSETSAFRTLSSFISRSWPMFIRGIDGGLDFFRPFQSIPEKKG